MTTPGHRPGQWYMEVMHCPDPMAPLLAILTRSKGIQIITFGPSLAAGFAGILLVLTANCLQGTIPDFLTGFTFIGFSIFGYGCKAVKI